MTDWTDIERRVAAAFADRQKLSDPVHRAAVVQALHGLDRGELRVAEKVGGEWKVNAWLMQA
ncbi:MAG TPA: 2,3,4,5-tetrahydropyridine-2,6-dicarboxylate N-succinyltransferase, partial [Anaeromyxobacter sp.]|nr:2,3,4,5-tetrahydropyridine-2,6-dicarboxylate N-succinyltransferase [Anaeromyxobacter sp.]